MPAVNIAPYIRNQYFDDNGVPLNGGLLYSYAAGTSQVTNKATYSDSEGTTANANPIVLDSAGRAQMFLESGAYDFVLKDSDGVTIWTEEGVSVSSITTTVNTMTEMKALIPGSYTIMRTLGRLTVNDGGGWWYYWSSSSAVADDGGMVIQPTSLPATGRWIGLMPSDRELNVRIYGAVCDGTTDDTSKLVACNTWCAANKCIILVDSSIYCATNPSLTAKVKLLPSAQFRYGNFNPTLDVIIDGNDKTQHFNCPVSYYPILNTNEIYPEWFGETISSYPITIATIAHLTNQKTKLMYSIAIKNDLPINGILDICSTSINIFGCDTGGIERTNNTTKESRIGQYHYSNSEEPASIIMASSTDANNFLGLGGGSSLMNAATEIDFYTAANNTTTAGTKRGYVGSSGGLIWGSPTGGDKGAGTINATAVYDDNVALTGYVLDKAFNPEFDIDEWGKKTKAVNEFINRENLMLDVNEYCEFIKSRRMLPTFEDIESSGDIPSTGAMIQKLWEVVEIQSIHIHQLNERLKKMEIK